MDKANARDKAHFAGWGAKGASLVGSDYHVLESLSEEELERIARYLDFDMVGSPNHVRLVYDGDGSTFGLSERKAPNAVGTSVPLAGDGSGTPETTARGPTMHPPAHPSRARTRRAFYGYGWFLRDLRGRPAACARGFGGQFVHVVPDAELVVAITSDVARAARGDGCTDRLHALVGDLLA